MQELLATGLDPEALIIGGEHLVPASLFIEPEGESASIDYDNASVEIRPGHSTNLSTLTRNTGDLVREMMARLDRAKKRDLVPPDSQFILTPSHYLHESCYSMESVSHFGCSPSCLLADDYSVLNALPYCGAEETAARSAGFHIHQELPSEQIPEACVAILDGLLGLLDVAVCNAAGWRHQSRMRRNHLGYGRAGEFRVRTGSKREILEYRTLSPWPLAAPSRVRWVTEVMKDVCSKPPEKLLKTLDKYPDRSEITSVINESPSEGAPELWHRCASSWEWVASTENWRYAIMNAATVRPLHTIEWGVLHA